jgi:Amt family ammonium transporter
MDKDITALQVIFTETYYWITVVMMFLIHVGFCTTKSACHGARTTSPH